MDPHEIITRTRSVFEQSGIVRTAALFGSHAHGDATPDSDVDFLLSLEDGVGLLRLEALRLELERALGRRVDVVSERGVKPGFRESVGVYVNLAININYSC